MVVTRKRLVLALQFLHGSCREDGQRVGIDLQDRRSVRHRFTAAFDMVGKDFRKFLSDHIQVRAVFEAGVGGVEEGTEFQADGGVVGCAGIESFGEEDGEVRFDVVAGGAAAGRWRRR